jgi:hypothetical protein
MNTRIVTSLVVSLSLLGCSTSKPPAPAIAAMSVQAVAAPEAPEPSEVPEVPEVLKGRICQLGTSCLALDDRPFEMCLLGTNKRCSDQIREPLLVENPVEPPDAGPR